MFDELQECLQNEMYNDKINDSREDLDDKLLEIFKVVDKYMTENSESKKSTFPNISYLKDNGISQHYINKYTLKEIKRLYYL
jgi:hypothetical protein